jgi:hypothetical protein
VPVLVTYDSRAVRENPAGGDGYRAAIEDEVRGLQARFAAKDLPADVVIHLVLVPLADKAALLESLDTRLRGLQTL